MKFCALLVLPGLTAATPFTPAADPNASPDGIDNRGANTNVWTLDYNGSGTTPANHGSFLGDSGGSGGGSGGTSARRAGACGGAGAFPCLAGKNDVPRRVVGLHPRHVDTLFGRASGDFVCRP